MSSRVFISYRREDSKWQARMIYEAFERVLGRECVFMDIDSIPPGADFRKILKDWVDSCDILLALIGPGWIDAMDRKAGKRRIDDANDFVRIEIAEALARGIPVVPVLLDGASLPDIHLLPDDLRALVDRQAEVVEYRTFDNDVARLIRRLGLGPLGIPSVSSPRGQLLRSDEEPISKKGRVKVHVGAASTERARWIKAGGGHDPNEAFQDLVSGPEMVLVPAGELTMGSPTSEEGRFGGEGPQRTVTIVRPFAVGRFPVTFDEWDAAVAAGGCKAYRPPDEGWGRGRHPVIHVSWHDAKRYVAWLSSATGKTYRLLSEAEWEYASRAATTTPFWWGLSISTNQANYYGTEAYGRGFKGEFRRKTVTVDTFAANPWGLYQLHGNVWEWVEDCWNESYDNAPIDGSAWTIGDCDRRVCRGGSWVNGPRHLRAANRGRNRAVVRSNDRGFRVARTLDA